MSLFLLLILFSFSNDGSQVSQSEDKAVRREKKGREGKEGRKEGRNETLHGWQNLVLSSFFLLPFFFLSFLWLLLLVIINYYWTRLRCVASDPGNSWYSVKKGCCLLRSSLWFLRLCFSWVSFSWPFFLTHSFLCLEIMSVGFVFPLSFNFCGFYPFFFVFCR